MDKLRLSILEDLVGYDWSDLYLTLIHLELEKLLMTHVSSHGKTEEIQSGRFSERKTID
jgi:hypothetical protein